MFLRWKLTFQKLISVHARVCKQVRVVYILKSKPRFLFKSTLMKEQKVFNWKVKDLRLSAEANNSFTLPRDRTGICEPKRR